MAENASGQPLEETPNFRFAMSARTHFVMDDEVLAVKDESGAFMSVPIDAVRPELARSLVDEAINKTETEHRSAIQNEIYTFRTISFSFGGLAGMAGFLGYEFSNSWEKAGVSVLGAIFAVMAYGGHRVTKEVLQSKSSPRLLSIANKLKSLQLVRQQLSEQAASIPE